MADQLQQELTQVTAKLAACEQLVKDHVILKDTLQQQLQAIRSERDTLWAKIHGPFPDGGCVGEDINCTPDNTGECRIHPLCRLNRPWIQAKLQAREEEVKSLKEESEVGLQLTGSFFEALKPLKLSAIYVQNPGQHITDLIAHLRAREEEIKKLQLINFDHEQGFHAATTEIASQRARLDVLERGLKDCDMMARRMLHRSQPVDPEWSHIARFCKQAGIEETGVLRDLATRENGKG